MNKLTDAVQGAAQKAMQAAIGVAPESWLPGGTPDRLAGKHGLIGAPVSRIDGPLKVSGGARFAAEIPLPGLLHAALVHSIVPRGRIATLDTAAAEAAPGVALVMTHRNAPRMKPPALFGTAANAAGPSSLPVMQDDEIRWNGHPVALVLAETREQADHAATLVEISYDTEAATVSLRDARAHAHPPDSILGEPASLDSGDTEAALKAADVSVDLAYSTPFYNHNAIELHAATCHWEGDRLTVHDASQLITATAGTLAGIFDMPAENVRVLSPYVGGGFGGKCLWWHQILGAAAAKLAGRPVRIALSRESVYRMVGGRTTTEQRVALGARRDGAFTALIHTGVAAMTAHNNCPEQFTFPARHMYRSEAIKVAQDIAEMDMIANTFMRAPGESIGSFALESAIDELAEKLGMDPIALRRRNDPEKDPTSGREFSSRHLMKAYDDGAARFGWDRREARPRSRREGEWLIGMGCASGTYPYYRMPGGSARITLSADGKAIVAAAAHEMGMGTATVQAQVCAERLGLPKEDVTFELGDTRLPPSPVAGGSCQTASIGAAVIAAYDKLVPELLKLAGNGSPLAGLSAGDVEGRDGGLASRADPARHESYAAILARAGRAELCVEAAAPPPLEQMRWSMHSTSAIFAEVRVNAITGEPRVKRLLGSFDCGRILNSKTAMSQFRGGMIMGIGLALTEETMVDERNGRIMNPSLAEYHVPVHLDVPEIDVIWTDIADPHTPMGARGIGEIGITGTGAAIANAVYNATGIRVRDLPITLDKLLG
jgi:xanthine dehydrogenase YagR molybdenum-binding subunit